MRLLTVFLALSMIMFVGCSNVSERGEGVFPPSMKAVVSVNETEYPMEEGGYEWSRKKGLETEVITTDHASPNQMAETIEPILLQPGQEVVIQIEDDPDITVYLWNDRGREKPVETNANQFTLPTEKGRYIYEAEAKWKNGTVSYTFVVEVQ